ncbi:MAG: tRNA dihydrouridine synthase DusB [Gammaproteobacteria bacterium]|nr:MAG: tRNA dihydrouridine synthase DusB [Gammaproteobacteria bacterium]
MALKIGQFTFSSNIGLAPMAGVTDRPFRQLCRQLGAGVCPSEMLTSDTRLWNTAKSRRRLDHAGEPAPIIVQIAGGEPGMMADAAARSVDVGAQIVDINMGCPAKKVCSRWAGSALLRDEALVKEIIEAVVAAVPVPVTLKMRTGWNREERNGIRIARLAEQIGIAALSVHGRTRADMYRGEAEYETIRRIKASVSIPVLANGDIDSPQKAAQVLASTGADGLLIGRAAQGRPWIFREVCHYLRHGTNLAPPTVAEVRDIMLAHLDNLYSFYGEYTGVRVARKHLTWYCRARVGAGSFRHRAVRAESAAEQLRMVREFLDQSPQEELAA